MAVCVGPRTRLVTRGRALRPRVRVAYQWASFGIACVCQMCPPARRPPVPAFRKESTDALMSADANALPHWKHPLLNSDVSFVSYVVAISILVVGWSSCDRVRRTRLKRLFGSLIFSFTMDDDFWWDDNCVPCSKQQKWHYSWTWSIVIIVYWSILQNLK